MLTFCNSYLGLEFANAVLLFIGELRVIQYYPSLIALDFISLFADSTLLSFLLILFAKRIYDHAGKDDSSIILYKGYCWVISIIAIVNIPAFFYQGFGAIMGEETQKALTESGGIKFKILASYKALNVSFYGVYLGGVFILAWITISHLRRLGKAMVSHMTLKICVPLLIVSLLARTIGKFIYAILFVLQARTKSPTIQLIHTIFYGLLSVLIYGSIMVIAHSGNFSHEISTARTRTQYDLVRQSAQYGSEYKSGQATVYDEETTHTIGEPHGYEYSTREYDNPSQPRWQ